MNRDTDGNGILKYAQTQVTNEALIVVDDHCIVAGTDTNYPWTNQFQIDETVEFFQEVSDSRFMVICFVEPIFNLEHPFLKDFGSVAKETSGDDKETVNAGGNDGSEDAASGGDPVSPTSRSLMHTDTTDYWHGATVVFGGLILAVGGWLLAV